MSGENESRHYYDSRTVVYHKKNVIRVWTKIQFAEGMEKKEGVKTLKESDQHLEVNCLQREFLIIDGKEWYWDGKTTSSDEPTKLINIPPDSAIDLLSKKLCKAKGKKNKKSAEKE